MTGVLMTADTVGGVWTYAVELAAALGARGVAVHLATMGPRMSADQRADASVFASVQEGDYALEWMPDPWADVARAGDWLLGLAADLRPDVVHLNGYAHGALPWPAPAVVVGHSDVLSWWRAVHGTDAPPEWDAYRAAVAAGLAGAAAVVAPTRAAADDLVRWYGAGDVTVVPNGRRADWVRDVPKEPLVVGSGRVWDPAKNLALLDAAAGDLPWPVVIAGDDAGPGGAHHAGAHHTGRLAWPELADLLLRASVFVAPARYEPFGLGALEAALAGCALVLGDVPSLREVWGDAAVYVAPDDAATLVATVRRLAGDADELGRLRAAARGRAAAYTADRTAEAYLGVYAARTGSYA